jgi:hypothetical protein
MVCVSAQSVYARRTRPAQWVYPQAISVRDVAPGSLKNVGQVLGGQIGLEDAELQTLAVVQKHVADSRAVAVIGHVIANQVMRSIFTRHEALQV